MKQKAIPTDLTVRMALYAYVIQISFCALR